jgi:hypothetical protein
LNIKQEPIEEVKEEKSEFSPSIKNEVINDSNEISPQPTNDGNEKYNFESEKNYSDRSFERSYDYENEAGFNIENGVKMISHKKF